MTTSNALRPHPGNYTDEESLLDIYENLPKDEPKSNEVRVCPVPRSFRSAKPEAFTPQFVALGSYHHYCPNLPMTDELKLGVSRRFLKVPDNRDAHQLLQNSLSDSDIQIRDFYHKDAPPYMLSTDGLFLLGLLRSGAQEYSSNFILTGKHYGLPPVNAAGVELSMDGIIRDVFMLENQIPSLVLKHLSENINNENEIKSSDNDLGSVMVNFCKAHSPLVVHSEKISKDPKTHDHLLDLMYCLIVSEPQLQPQLDPEPNLRVNIIFRFAFHLCVFYLYVAFGLSLILFTILLIIPYGVVVIVQPFLQLICFVLVRVIPWSGAILDRPKIEIQNPLCFLTSVWDYVFFGIFIVRNIFSLLLPRHRFPYPIPVLAMDKACQFFIQLRDSINFSYKVTTIPSATYLYNNAWFRFKPVEGDISSIKFDEEKREFCLPCIKLDATSEVILRNLMVYESLIKSDRLNFSSYIELMRGLIHTAEDVKLLVDKKIIQTQLSPEVVTQIFNMPIGELIERPTEEIQKLEGQLKKIKQRLDAIDNLVLIFFEFVRICLICGIIVVFSPMLAQACQQIWCSTVFGESSESCKRHQVGIYGRNNYNIGSM